MLAQMYLKVKGRTQGEIKGSVTQKDHGGKILIHGFKHSYDMPANLQAGRIVSSEARGVLTLTKEMDQSSPQFWQALGKREFLDDFVFEIYRPKKSGAGLTELDFTLKLKDVLVTRVEAHSSEPLKEGEASGALGNMEDVSFAYQGFELEHKDSGISGQANWVDG